jgi:hypothetical protein
MRDTIGSNPPLLPKLTKATTTSRGARKTAPTVMQPTQTLTTDQRFFFDHAGYSYTPGTETPEQGRTRCAIMCANAEDLLMRACRVADVGTSWEDDPDGWEDWRADKRAGRSTTRPETIEQATIWHRDPEGSIHYLASLGAIQDADSDYRRVIRAELAIEAETELRAIVNAEG